MREKNPFVRLHHWGKVQQILSMTALKARAFIHKDAQNQRLVGEAAKEIQKPVPTPGVHLTCMRI